MGFYVHLHTAFEVQDAPKLQQLAIEELRRLDLPLDAETAAAYERDDENWTYVAGWFLSRLAKNPPIFRGPKGQLCLWGMVTNHAHGKEFVQSLLPFWVKAIVEEAVFDFQRILVFEEPEQSNRVRAWEIGSCDQSDWVQLNPETSVEAEASDLRVRFHHTLPFSWGLV